MHSVSFFGMTNDVWMSRSLAGAFELGQLAAMAGLMTLERSSKKLIATLMITLTGMQIMANMYFSYAHVDNAIAWFELFGLQNTDPILAKRILAAVSGGLLPLIALGFSKSLVDYLKPEVPVQVEPETIIENLPAHNLMTEQQIQDYMDYYKKSALEAGAEKSDQIKNSNEPTVADLPETETTKQTQEDYKPIIEKDNIVLRNGIPTGPPAKKVSVVRDAELPDVF